MKGNISLDCFGIYCAKSLKYKRKYKKRQLKKSAIKLSHWEFHRPPVQGTAFLLKGQFVVSIGSFKMCISSRYTHLHIEFYIYLIYLFVYFICDLHLKSLTEMLRWVIVGKKYICCLVQWQWFMLLGSISAMEICITRLDEDCYTDGVVYICQLFGWWKERVYY